MPYLRCKSLMTYSETIEYLYSRLPMFSRIGDAAIKKDITNTRLLCEWLGQPQQHFPSLHIAGTNGKGSTSHMLAAAFQACGYRTGLYTSPHLLDFRERISINGQMIPQDAVVHFVQRIQPELERIEPSFFEVTVAMAFDYFAHQQVDLAVIETGLGGRLDSTNIIQPKLSIITNIGFDHLQLLGDTLDKIAFEKAGIIKFQTPVVVGEDHPLTRPVFIQKALQEEAPLHFANACFQVEDCHTENQQLKVSLRKQITQEIHTYSLDLPGHYQAKNLVTVLTAIDLLRSQGWRLPSDLVKNGIQQTRKLTGLRGRWELVHQQPKLLVDVAHNAEGMREVIQQLSATPYSHLHWIIGFAKDKDVENMLSMLPDTATYYFTKAQLPRALNENDLQSMATQQGLKGRSYPVVVEALREALLQAKNSDLILVCGSIYLAGEAIEALTTIQEPSSPNFRKA